MDFFTAGIALIVTQLCVALVMAGIYLLAPTERCTRYWALSEAFLASGLLLVVLNAEAARPSAIILGNNLLIWGTILQWWGIQAFYRVKPGKAGWVIGTAFFVAHALLLVSNFRFSARILLFSATLLVLLSLSFHALWRETRTERGFAGWLVLGAIATLMVNNVARMAAALSHDLDLRPVTHSSAAVIMLLVVPMAGILVYATGLLLLYFERIVKEKHHLATHDELTGLLNRRAIVDGGEREVTVAARRRLPLAVALVDIDFFKKINDELGHDTGDAVLIGVARLLKKSCREVDLVGRYGGEEFCIVLPGVDAGQCATIGERLVATARQYRFQGRCPLTVSIGFAAMSANDSSHSWTDLITRADAELYKAKNLGRDQFCVSNEKAAAQAGGIRASAGKTLRQA